MAAVGADKLSSSPIFIVGLSYSGKTQLRLMLNTHPNIWLVRRSRMWTHLPGCGDLSRPDRVSSSLEALLGSNTLQAYALDREALLQEFLQGPAACIHLFGVIYRACARSRGAARGGEQLGAIDREADRIFEAFPGARMIHMIRDPRTRFLTSIRDKRKRRGRAGWELARWRRSVRWAERNRKRYPDGCLVVRFEALASDPGRTMAHITDFVGERFHADRLPDWAEIRPRSPVPDQSHRLELAYIQRSVRPELSRLGYASKNLPLSAVEWAGYLGVHLPTNLAADMAWQVLHARA